MADPYVTVLCERSWEAGILDILTFILRVKIYFYVHQCIFKATNIKKETMVVFNTVMTIPPGIVVNVEQKMDDQCSKIGP